MGNEVIRARRPEARGANRQGDGALLAIKDTRHDGATIEPLKSRPWQRLQDPQTPLAGRGGPRFAVSGNGPVQRRLASGRAPVRGGVDECKQ